MATDGKNDRQSYIYLGLAGETGRGRVVQSGLYRMADGGGEWEALLRGLPEAPAVRALAVHPLHPEIVFAGTQSGPYRSEDRGEHWEKVNLPDHGLPVWSFLFHPYDPDVMFVGYENCEICRSDDGGERWIRLPVSVRFPEITTAPGSNPAKRVLMLDASVSEPDHLYAAIEVGGTIRSTDGGEHWENLSHGQYLNDDAVDMHGVLASRWRPGTVFGIGRAGMFHSADGGDHWRHVTLEPMNPKGQIYCRDIREVPGNPRKLFVAAGAQFPERCRRAAVQRRRRRHLVPCGYGRPAAAHHVRAGVRRAPARADVLRHQWRRGLRQSRRRRDLVGAPAAAGRHADLRPRPRLNAPAASARGFFALTGSATTATALPGTGGGFRRPFH